MGKFDGRVVAVTGAGGGIGREHALRFAAEGAQVVVNDLGSTRNGAGADGSAAQTVVDEIVAAGGTAVANTSSVSSWEGARSIVTDAVEAFGDLHVVVNNAGFVRDKTIVGMSEEDFDSVVAVHLKGTFAVTHWAAAYWRDQAKAGSTASRRLVNTTSHSGLYGNPGQVNYASAKMGIVGLTVVAARELERYHVRANVIAPLGRTRMTTGTQGFEDALAAPEDPDAYDRYHPGHNSSVAMFLATDESPFTGQVFEVLGGRVGLFGGPTVEHAIEAERFWTIEDLAAETKGWPVGPPSQPGL
ncbi:SDR family NAD(P)-dependent oxidoreductase [Cryptosporangium sp. NPDC051539]|uniref:SDR family NAD(P)-dependent oxidoreductase n=1 Tax=Cryptosporangium sp. NPDC051539 TaxID=3363962 RepID=UPI0037894460